MAAVARTPITPEPEAEAVKTDLQKLLDGEMEGLNLDAEAIAALDHIEGACIECEVPILSAVVIAYQLYSLVRLPGASRHARV
jgi:hypothetical protein